jgi:hypothetical protein
MAVDWVLHYSCPPKEALGGGDPLAGTERLLDCIKAGNRAAAIADIARRAGDDPRGKPIVVQVRRADGEVEERETSYDELMSEAQELRPHEAACRGCPANVLGRPFGCVGAINYPIRRAAEEWLAGRLQPASAVGGKLFLAAVRDFGYTGEPLRQFRAGGLFEADRPVRKVLKRGLFSSESVTSDQLFQAIFCIGEPLDPGHCLGILLWLGCLCIDGAVVESPEQALALNRLGNADERRGRTSLELGGEPADGGIEALQLLLRAMYASWVLDAPLWVSA